MGDGVEMIPMKMPKTPPDSADEFPKKDALHLRWEGTYLPNNLIHRLLIRKFPELDTKCVWRTGGRFRQIGGGCEALAEMNDKALDVYVNGDRDCRPYLETFRGVIRNILDGLHLKTSEVICCTIDGEEGSIPYEDVVQQYYDKQERVYISGIRKYVNPAQLLRDTYYDWESDNPLEMKIQSAELDLKRAELELKREEIKNTREEATGKQQDNKEKRVKFNFTVAVFVAVIIILLLVIIVLCVVAVRHPEKLSELWNLAWSLIKAKSGIKQEDGI